MEQKKKAPTGLLGFLGARGRIWLLLGGVLAGIFLIVAGGMLGTTESGGNATLYEEDLEQLLAYEAQLEKEIAKLCGEVAGVGQVDVMLRLQGGTRVLYATDEKGKPASVGSGSTEQPLHSSILMPEVAGVAIVCRGGDTPHIQKTLTDLVSTALGIPTSRVAVTGK